MISITDGLQAIYNSNMREKTPLELERESRMLKQQIDQLTNNWNELEKWLEYEIYCNFNGMKTIAYKDCLDKMKEIKERNNVQNNN